MDLYRMADLYHPLLAWTCIIHSSLSHTPVLKLFHACCHAVLQVAAWRRVTDAVHARGGTIVCQLLHCGRATNASLTPGNATPVAPSAVPIEPAGPVPRALSVSEIQEVIQSQYRQGARLAKEAGFDGGEWQWCEGGHVAALFWMESWRGIARCRAA
jgi:2,4-dienoyl-CoA reductase-like NADH-dependent reductase (Old Yellow Enzyme family)